MAGSAWLGRDLRRVVVAAPYLIWWLLITPLLFVLLYSTLELQRAARAALPTEADVANYRVLGLANDIRALQRSVTVDEAAARKGSDAFDREKDIFDTDRSLARQAILDYAAIHHIDVDPTTCPADWLPLSGCYDAVRQKAGAKGESAYQPFSVVSTAMVKAKMEVIPYNQAIRDDKAVESRLKLEKDRLTDLLAGKDQDGITGGGAVAFNFDRLRTYFPVIPYLFVLPSGVVVAFFAGVMGSIGGAIGSVSNQITPTKPTVSTTEAYLVRPLFGLLAGFIVFFVVAAGAAFLVQPAFAAASSAVNNLSPPALASLGIFAGLSSELAVKWLTDKANQFFS